MISISRRASASGHIAEKGSQAAVIAQAAKNNPSAAVDRGTRKLHSQRKSLTKLEFTRGVAEAVKFAGAAGVCADE